MFQPSLIFLFLSSFTGVRMTFSHEGTKTLKPSSFTEGINHSLCQRYTANVEHLKSQRHFPPAGFA